MASLVIEVVDKSFEAIPRKSWRWGNKMTAVLEQDVIDSIPATFKLSSGLEVEIQELKTRQFFRLLRIITHGAPAYLDENITSLFTGDSEDTAEQLITLILFAIPEAEDQTLDFLSSMVAPVDLHVPAKSKTEKAENVEKWQRVEAALINPPLEDTIDLVEQIVRRESGNLASLGNRLLSMISKMNPGTSTSSELVDTPESSEELTQTGSLEATPEPSTSSARNTDGPTVRSLDSLLDE